MSSFQDLLLVIRQLAIGTEVTITVQWCSDVGLTVTPILVKDWGKRIAKNPQAYDLKPKIINPGAGRFENKTSDNLSHYEKI